PTAPIERDAHSGQGDFGLFVKCDGRRGVECNPVPDQLGSTIIEALLSSEGACGIRSFNFKSQRTFETFCQTKVVQNSHHREHLAVMRSLIELSEDRRKEPGSHDMIE